MFSRTKTFANLSYGYDKFGNLASRKDNLRNLEESFHYDNMNRLPDIYLGSTHSQIVYDPLGRMTSKQADGQTVFANAGFAPAAGQPARPHAMKSAATTEGVFPDANQSIAYTSFDKVKAIVEDGNSIIINYGYDQQRIRMYEIKADGNAVNKDYVGVCEYVTESFGTGGGATLKTFTYLVGPYGVFAVVEHGDEERIHYILKDHLGSWTTITDSHGNVEQELSFDAWGTRRNPETWQSSSQLAAPMFDRGFTGHEHLYAFGLINMNGRMYDPQMSSFLSVDAYVQSPDNSQSFNRYAYCLNNPLKYTDPSGWVMQGGMTPSNPFHENWGGNFAEKAYTSVEVKQMLWSMGVSTEVWMEENELHGGGGSPVYDEHGYFMGTDDGGLQGEAIVMKRDDFVQGMKHEEALSLATYLDENDKDAEIRLYYHFRELSNRPDWDGFITIEEGIDWAKSHPNAASNPTPDNTLYVDANLLDLGFLTMQNSGLKAGQDYRYVNLYDYVNGKSLRSINTTYALGNTKIKLLDNNGTISFQGDIYDWDYHKNSPMRNFLIFLERKRTGLNDNHGFQVKIYGTTKINKKWPF